MRLFFTVLCLVLCSVSDTFLPDLMSSCKVNVGISSPAKTRDHQMTSSSHLQAFNAENARLNGPRAWCPGLSVQGSPQPQQPAWLQVNLLVSHFICQFGVQGSPVHDEWVTLYRVSYSMDENRWEKEEYFSRGNKNRLQEKVSVSPIPRLAKYVRFTVLHYHNYPCMRVELYGKKVWDFQSSFITYLSSQHSYIRVRPSGTENWADNHESIQSIDLDVETDIGSSAKDKKFVHYLSANKDIFIDLPPEPSGISPGNEVLIVIPNARYLSGKVTEVQGSDLYVIRRSDNGRTEVMKRAYLRQRGGKPCEMDNKCPVETDCKNDELHRPAKYYCICKAGFIEAIKDFASNLEGKCIDIDECSNGISKCPEQSRCINSLGSFRCSCSLGYIKSSGGQCVDVDECTFSPSPCSSGFSCHNSLGSFKCHDIDECLSSPCWGGELCVNTQGAFRCEIPPMATEKSKKKMTTIKIIQSTKTPQKRTLPVITHVITQAVVNGSKARALNHLYVPQILLFTLIYRYLCKQL